jgi:hypothetical protein
MNNDARLEVRLPAKRRAQLDAMADEAGLSPAALARLAIARLLEERVIELPRGTAKQGAT